MFSLLCLCSSEAMEAGFGRSPFSFVHVEFAKHDQELNSIFDIITQPIQHEI